MVPSARVALTASGVESLRGRQALRAGWDAASI